MADVQSHVWTRQDPSQNDELRKGGVVRVAVDARKRREITSPQSHQKLHRDSGLEAVCIVTFSCKMSKRFRGVAQW